MSTFISDLSLKNPLVLDGVRLLEFKTRFPDTPVPFFVQKSYESLCNQKLTRHVSNPVELENLPKLIPRIMNGQIFSKDTSFFSRGKKIVLKANKIAETITLASFNSIYKAKNKKHWFEKLEKELKDKEFLPLGKVPHMTDDLHSHLEKTIKNLKVEGENDHYLHIKRKLMNIRDRMVDKQGKQDYTWNSYSLFQEADIVYNGWFLILNTGEKYIMDYEYVLMLCDLSIMRYNVREITIISNKIRDEDLPDISIIDDIFKWFDDTLDIFGNESYNIFKMYESICIGVYQLKYETYSSCRELLNNILKQNEDTGYLERLKALAQIIERSKNPNQIFELFGLFRFGGHPIVNESAGCEKQKNLTRQEIEIDEDVMILSFGCFVRTFIINYVKKNKMWPDIDIDKTEENIINMSLDPDDFITYLKQNSLVFTHFDEHKDYRLWSCVHFNRLFIYNDFEDFTELLSDTSISAELESFMTAYDKNLIDPDLNFCDKKPQFKRTLMGLLMSKDFDLKEIRKVFETGNIPESWKVVALHSKERELKIEPRLFAMFCLQLRMLFAGMEKNLADGIFKYIETQTMTMSESELNDRLTSMTNPHKNQDYIPFLVATDMEKFNQRWREKALTKMEKLLDQIYGVKCYSQSMKIYKECTFYLSSRFHPPSYSEQNFKRSGIKFFQPLSKISKRYRKKCIKILKKLGKTLDTDTVWFGQDGGTEGTQQKKWTATIGIPIIYTSDQLGITIILIGQGDNQNFLLLIPKTLLEQYLNGNFSELDMKIKEIIDTFLKRLKDNLSAYGMILKLDETYVNSHLLNYGKEIIYKGCYVSSKLKRYSRTFSDINEPIPTLDSRIASIYSNSHSTSGKSFDCITSYFLAIKECVYTLSYEFLRRPTEYSDVFKFHKQIDNKDLINDDFLILVFLISKDFGGLPIMPLTDLLYRGHPDCLTSYLSWLKSISDEVPMAKKIMNWIVCSNRLSKSDSLLPLIMDPTSINWVNEYIDQSRPKTLLEDSVRSKVVNRDIKMLLNHASKEERDSIVSFLETIEPCFPRGLNEIFRQTPQGVMLQFLSMFTDMRTIKEALTKEEAIELIHMVRNKDYNRFKYLCQAYIEIQDLDIMISGNLTLNEEERTVLSQAWSCTTTLADKLREKSYGRKIIGSTMPHPSEQTALFPVEGTKCERCELTSESNSYIYYKINSDNKFDFFPH
ncbi:MAG: RNA-dependent RNA polymerase [Arlivirus sp. XZN142933]|nr:MAG: RNA-dependent RNA polymerase [Arlivirus sp. XZN142933]